MSSRRVLKAAQAIREVVSMAIIAELKDPRIADVTVTFVEVSGDLRHAKVHVSVMGDDTKKRLCLKGLQNSAGYLQKKVGNRIDTRYTPRLHFELDKGLEHSMLVTKILDDVLPPNENQESPPNPELLPSEKESPHSESPHSDSTPDDSTPDDSTPDDSTPDDSVAVEDEKLN